MFQPQLDGAVAPATRLPEELSLYRALFENSSDAISVIDGSGRYVHQNPAHKALTGYSLEELTGQTPAFHFGEDVFARAMQELRATGRFHGELISTSKHGEERLLDVTAYGVPNADGKILYYVAVKRDITQRRRTEEEVKRRFTQLNALYNMTARVTRSSSMSEIYGESLRCLFTAMQADRASILMFDGDGVMRFKAQRGLSEAYCKAVEGHSPWGRDTNDARPIAVNDVAVEMEGALREVVLNEGIRALAFIPLLAADGLLGKFMLYFDAPHHFTADELKLAQTIATQVSMSITRARADETMRAREREFRALADHLERRIERSEMRNEQRVSFTRLLDNNCPSVGPECIPLRSSQLHRGVGLEKIKLERIVDLDEPDMKGA